MAHPHREIIDFPMFAAAAIKASDHYQSEQHGLPLRKTFGQAHH